MVCSIPMTQPIPPSSPQVLTPQRVAQVSRALFVSLGALLGPLMSQYLFGPGTLTVKEWLPPMLVTPLFALMVSRTVTQDAPSTGRAVLRVVRRTLSLGILHGLLFALLWSAVPPNRFGAMAPAAIFYGAFYGFWAALIFALPFSLWTLTARHDLNAPSMVSREMLTLRAGMFISFAGLASTLFYRHEVLQTLGQCVGVAGFATTVLGLVGVFKVSRFFEGIETASIPNLRVVERGDDLSAPAVVSAGTLDRLAVIAPETLDSSPFRANANTLRLAAVPSDLTVGRRALNRAIAFGAIALLVVTATDALSLAAPYLSGLACPSSACAACSH